jgi:hypothetical protein
VLGILLSNRKIKRDFPKMNIILTKIVFCWFPKGRERIDSIGLSGMTAGHVTGMALFGAQSGLKTARREFCVTRWNGLQLQSPGGGVMTRRRLRQPLFCPIGWAGPTEFSRRAKVMTAGGRIGSARSPSRSLAPRGFGQRPLSY